MKKKGVFEKFKVQVKSLIISLIPVLNIALAITIATDCFNIYEKVITECAEKIEEVEKI